ncbi:protein-disulfide reductase DsbD family protein [Roseospira visakhapatnamensis]|uniref:Suppressor for copper-sensitivity B n=1 Tax=Roseospira visakhapatnamensis TaxID=390880 RepID=A0A7W6RBG8_9PROT|nr:protein-disulfide reductase DsbD domain-containing protein [Roseospira visakhapatnamensis]MBB4264869.1 suppressor for copper-sensitivity B [Roseospira visakhapatnamensis]
MTGNTRTGARDAASGRSAWGPLAALWSPLVLLLVILVTGASPAVAQLPEWTPPGSSAWAETPEGRVRLISATTALGGRETLRLGLQFDMVDDWKVYWRAPGDAGYPPTITWDGSRNLADATLRWPAPERFSVLGIQTIGYRDGVIYPLRVRPEDPGQSLRLVARVDYLTCADVCIPRAVDLTMDLPAGPGGATPYAHDLNRFESAVPGDGAAQGLTLEDVAVVDGGDGAGPADLVVQVVVRADPPLVAPDLFVEGPEGAWFDPPGVARDADGRVVLWSRVGGVPSLTGGPVTVTVVDGARGLEASAVVDAVTAPHPLVRAAGDRVAPATVAPDDPSWLTMLGLALLGGLILNLMPCVLPVLSLKVLGVMGHGGASPARARTSFVMSAAGIVASFLALGGAAIAVKAAGLAVGWGIQFQQPLFLVVMVVLLSLFAANLWGLFEVVVPQGLTGAASRGVDRAGGDDPGSAWGAFATGAFATLLATPCSAPFLGTAVGFALARGALDILAIFLALGVGMALPYLLVAARPGLATRLPRPGRWMLWLKAGLGVALAGTAVWLLSVLAAQVGAGAALAVGGLMALMVGALALPRGRWPAALVPALVALALPAWAGLLPGDGPRDALPATRDGGLAWRPLEPAAIPALLAEGRVVFVDVTADWCVTCIVNKRAVLDQEPVAGRLASAEVVLMRGDWTRPDAAIAAYLAGFGRYGIPFNAVYGARAPDGLALPELLTSGVVLEALDTAGLPAASR